MGSASLPEKKLFTVLIIVTILILVMACLVRGLINKKENTVIDR